MITKILSREIIIETNLIYRSYLVKSDYTNQAKLDQITALAKIYRLHYNVASSHYSSYFYLDGKIGVAALEPENLLSLFKPSIKFLLRHIVR